MNTNNETKHGNEQFKLMAYDGLALMVKRSLSRLTEVVGLHYDELSVAAEDDYSQLFSNEDFTPGVLLRISELRASLNDAESDLQGLKTYWNSLARPATLDRKADPSADECCCCGGRGQQEAQTTGGLSAEEEAQLKDSLDWSIGTSAPAEFSSISPPDAHFDPELLASKRVTKVQIKNDVRQKVTVGKASPDFVVGDRPPTIWLESVDGTRVTIHRDEIPGLRAVLEQMS